MRAPWHGPRPWEPEGHIEVCEREAATYVRIAALTMRVSDARESVKLDKLVELLEPERLVLAFDHSLITLHYFREKLLERGCGDVILATGRTGPDEGGRMSSLPEPPTLGSRQQVRAAFLRLPVLHQK